MERVLSEPALHSLPGSGIQTPHTLSTVSSQRFNFAGLTSKAMANPFNIQVDDMMKGSSLSTASPWGFAGYQVPKAGATYKYPVWSVPKNNPAVNEKARGARIPIFPGPGYPKTLSYSSIGNKTNPQEGKFHKCPRTSVIDEETKRKKYLPGYCLSHSLTFKDYIKTNKIPLGSPNKAIRNGVVSESEYMALTTPPPSHYKLEHKHVEKRCQIVDFGDPKKIERPQPGSWKVKKDDRKPGVGHYKDKEKADKHTSPRIYQAQILKDKRTTFTEREAKITAKYPSCGTYHPFSPKSEALVYKPMRKYH